VATLSATLQAVYVLVYEQQLSLSAAAAARGVEKPAISKAAARIRGRFAAASRADGNRIRGGAKSPKVRPVRLNLAPGDPMPKPTLVSVLTAIADPNRPPFTGHAVTSPTSPLSGEQAHLQAALATVLGLPDQNRVAAWILDFLGQHLQLRTPPELIVECLRRRIEQAAASFPQ
jgi:hypothetical protein